MAITNPRISYTPNPDATPEGEKSALAAVYKFLLDCYEKKKGGPTTAPNDAKKIKSVR
jgi:hypothetical protein